MPRLHVAVNKGGLASGRNCDNSYSTNDVCVIVTKGLSPWIIFLQYSGSTVRSSKIYYEDKKKKRSDNMKERDNDSGRY